MQTRGLSELRWVGKEAARQYAFLEGAHFTLQGRRRFWSHKELGSGLDSING